MADAFNQEDEYVEVNGKRKHYYFVREGQLRTMFSQFREEGIVPLSLAVILERRAHSSASGWFESSLDSCTSIVYPAKEAYAESERRFKVCSVSERVLALKRDTPLIQGALPLESYESVRGQEFLRKKVILGEDLKEEEAREHPVLLSFCQGDRSLLQTVVEKDFSEARRRGFNDKRMGLYLGDELSVPSERAACVVRLVSWSQFFGGFHLDGGYWRLVEVAPEALEAARLRSFELCERLSQRAYPVLKGQKQPKQKEGRVECIGEGETWEEAVRRNPELRYHVGIEIDGVEYHERNEIIGAFEKSIETLPDAQKEIARTGFYHTLNKKQNGGQNGS